MNNPWAVALVVLAGVLLLCLLPILVAGGGSLRRIMLALRCEWKTLRDADFRAKVEALLTPPAAAAQTPPKPSGAPVRALALLQREGRLLDFLLEDIPLDTQQRFLCVSAGQVLKPIERRDGFELCRIVKKIEPCLEDPRVQSRIDQRLLDRHFSELVSKHVERRLGTPVAAQ